MKSKKILVQLSGGLGNQMFMYATARALSLRLGYELHIDIQSGFKKDLEYKRVFDLQNFNIHYNDISDKDSYRFIGGDFIQKICRHIGFHLLNPSKKYIREINHKFNSLILNSSFPNDVFIEGYWQKELYFKDFEKIIRDDFKLITPISTNAKSYLNNIHNEGSTPIAIGVRRYQEVKACNLYQVEDENFYIRAIKDFKDKVKNPVFYIFTQVPEWVRKEVEEKIDANFIYVEGNKSYEDLFLFSQCKHFIVSNSTFYWWGAWLSSYADKEIVMSNKFSDSDLSISNKEHN